VITFISLQKRSFQVWKAAPGKLNEQQVSKALSGETPEPIFETLKIKQSSLSGESWNFSSPILQSIHNRIDGTHPKLGDVLHIGQGMQTGQNDVFGRLAIIDVKRMRLRDKWTRKRAANSDIEKYFIRDRGEFLVWVEDAKNFKDLPKPLQEYLRSNSKKLRSRAAFQRGNCEWWKYTWPLHKSLYSRPKIICSYLSAYNRFALDQSKRFIGLTDTVVMFKKNDTKENLLYFLGLLNSHALDFRFKAIAKLKSGGIYEYFWNSLSKLSVRRINFKSPRDKAAHDEIVNLVRRMVMLMPKYEGSKSAKERERLETMIASVDQQINVLVYDLYGLTKDEIALVEKSFEGQSVKATKRTAKRK